MIFEYITENTTLSFQSARDSGRSSPGTKSSGEEKNRENLGCPDFSRGEFNHLMIFEYITENTTLPFQSAQDSGRSSPGTKTSGKHKKN